MRREPWGFRCASEAETKAAHSVAPHLEVALTKNVHADQRIELERVGELYANHLLEYEGKAWCLVRDVTLVQSNPKCVTLDLSLTLRRYQRLFAKFLKCEGSGDAQSHPAD